MAPRIPASKARQQVQNGNALLVCAYEDEQKCNSIKIEDSLTLKELEARLPSIAWSQEMIFY